MHRTLLAANPSAMTLDGTRTHIVGVRRVVVIDPGPLLPAHMDAIAAHADGRTSALVLTHEHPDHAAAADVLAARLGVPVRSRARGTLRDGDTLATDAGPLLALATPGHTPDHCAFHWRAAHAVFCGDLMMGGLDTALVGAPEGDLDDYLHSLERLRSLRPTAIHPAHGPTFVHPEAAIDRYLAHRRDRERAVLAALAADAGRSQLDTLVGRVYGAALADELRDAAASAILAYLARLERRGVVERDATGWRMPDD